MASHHQLERVSPGATQHEPVAGSAVHAGAGRAEPCHPLLALQRDCGNRYVQRLVEDARGGGRPLEGGVGARMRAAFGVDFGAVRVHTDARADALNRTLNASASTLGTDIYFRVGAYRPATPNGTRLLAHELTHVVQQGGARSRAGLVVGGARTGLEREAESSADRVAAGRPVDAGRLTPVTGVTVQRAWIESESDSVMQWDQLRKGLRWYFDTRTQLMHYTVEDEHVILPKHKKAYFDAQGKAFTYEQWVSAGWMTSAEHGLPVAGPEKGEDGEQKKAKEYSGPTSGVEIENPVPFRLQLQRTADRGVIAAVETDSGEILAEFTTDMGSNPYTIENRTTPVVENDEAGMSARKDALSLLHRAIGEAGQVPTGSPISPMTGEGMKIVIRREAHKVVPAKEAKRPGIQITKGVSLPAMLADAPSRKGVFAEAERRWMQEYAGYAESFSTGHPDAEHDVVVVFGMLASLLHFYMLRIDAAMKKRVITEGANWDETGEAGIGGKGVAGDDVSRPDLVDPSEKNAWGLLPKTPPSEWLSGLKTADVALVKSELRKVPDKGVVNGKAWRAILGDIMLGKMIAGHAVPKFKIGGATGLAFEIRLPKAEEKERYRYSTTVAPKQGTSTADVAPAAALALPAPGTTVTREMVSQLKAAKRHDLLKILYESSEYPLEKFERGAMIDIQMSLGHY